MKLPSARICITIPAFLTLLSCGSETLLQPVGQETLLAVGVPHTDNVKKYGRRNYAAAVSAESTYVVRMTGLSGNADLKVYGADSTLTQPWYCMIDLTGAVGTESEYCIILATGSTMYVAVEGRELDLPSADYIIEVQAVPLVELPMSVPVHGEAPRGGVVVYVTDVLPGQKYVTGLTVRSDPAARMGIWGYSNGYSIQGNIGGPFDLIVETTGTRFYLAVDASVITSPTLQFVAVTTPSAVVVEPVIATSGAVFAGVPTIGFVEAEGESFYYAEGMPEGEHLISLLGLTAIAHFRVFADPLYTIERECTASTPLEQECVVTGTSAYFSVRTEGIGIASAGYVLLVR